MSCNERNHRALEQALDKMREERDEQTKRAKGLHGNVVGLEAKIRELETALDRANERNAEVLARAERAETKIVEIEAVLE